MSFLSQELQRTQNFNLHHIYNTSEIFRGIFLFYNYKYSPNSVVCFRSSFQLSLLAFLHLDSPFLAKRAQACRSIWARGAVCKSLFSEKQYFFTYLASSNCIFLTQSFHYDHYGSFEDLIVLFR